MAFKMKGFSGFGNSPFRNTDPTDKEKYNLTMLLW